jgi:hypothetical protein
MSNTIRREKAPEFQYFARRPGNRHGAVPCPAVKRNTHRRERLQARREIRVALGSES